MFNLNTLRVGVRVVSSLRAVLTVGACAISVTAASAQVASHEDDHDHDHGYLHFSHPIITESPSPDTKLRFDASFAREDGPPASRATGLAGEFEYAFSRSLSIAAVVPFVHISAPRSARASAFGSVELSAKAASFAFDESGVLVGGGFSLGLPTGSDAKGIGSGHLYEAAPFVDAAIRRGDVEGVAFITYSTLLNRRAGEENERAVVLNGSVLWRVVPQLELLGEISSSRKMGGAEGSYAETFLAPGIKLRPAAWPKLALGIAAIRGVGEARHTNAIQMSAFYHF